MSDCCAELAAAKSDLARLATERLIDGYTNCDDLQARLDAVTEVYGFLMRKYADPNADAATVLAVTRTSLRRALAAPDPRESKG